jgi:hypothetical protein
LKVNRDYYDKTSYDAGFNNIAVDLVTNKIIGLREWVEVTPIEAKITI